MICIFKYYKYIQQIINTYYLEYRGIDCDDININYQKDTKSKTNIFSCYDDSDDDYTDYDNYSAYESSDDNSNDNNVINSSKKNNFIKSEAEELFCKYH